MAARKKHKATPTSSESIQLKNGGQSAIRNPEVDRRPKEKEIRSPSPDANFGWKGWLSSIPEARAFQYFSSIFCSMASLIIPFGKWSGDEKPTEEESLHSLATLFDDDAQDSQFLDNMDSAMEQVENGVVTPRGAKRKGRRDYGRPPKKAKIDENDEEESDTDEESSGKEETLDERERSMQDSDAVDQNEQPRTPLPRGAKAQGQQRSEEGRKARNERERKMRDGRKTMDELRNINRADRSKWALSAWEFFSRADRQTEGIKDEKEKTKKLMDIVCLVEDKITKWADEREEKEKKEEKKSVPKGWLNKDQVWLYVFLEWRGALCLVHNNFLEEVDCSRRICQCPKPVASRSILWNWEGVDTLEKYVEKAKSLRVKVEAELKKGLERMYPDFAQQFPKYWKPMDKELVERMEEEQLKWFAYSFANHSAPIFLIDWIQDSKIISNIEFSDRIEFTAKARQLADKILFRGNKNKILQGFNGVKCKTATEGIAQQGYKCTEPHEVYRQDAAVYHNCELQYAEAKEKRIRLCGMNGVPSPLTRLEQQQLPTTFECTTECKCTEECEQKPKNGCQFVLALTNLPIKGLGVFTMEKIPRGTFISKMPGEVIVEEEKEGRDKRMFVNLPRLPELTLSPDNITNLFKCLNHSCAPNVVASMIVEDRRHQKWARFAVHTRQDIEAGTELEWDYHVGYPIELMETGFDLVCSCKAPWCRYSEEKWEEYRRSQEI